MTSLARIENVITVSNRRLQHSALRTLTISEILSSSSKKNSWRDHIAKGKKRAKVLYEFLENEEPTGRERSEDSKATATRYVAVKTMIEICEHAENSQIRDAIIDRIYQWFIDSAPLTEKPKLNSPKKPILKRALLPRPNSHSNLRQSKLDTTSEKLKMYQQRNLRASHVRRIHQLRENGDANPYPMPENQEDPNNVPDHHENQEVPSSINTSSTGFMHYAPETQAERNMNKLWAENRQREEDSRSKNYEVTLVLDDWSKQRGRDDAELLRRQESRMMAREVCSHTEYVEQENVVEQDPITRSSPIKPPKAIRPAKAPVVIKRANSTGMRFKNKLPPNFNPRTTINRKSTDIVADDIPTADKKEYRKTYESENTEDVSLYKPVVVNSMTSKTGQRRVLNNSSSSSSVGGKQGNSPHIRGTIPIERTPYDPEYKLFHNASQQRKVRSHDIVRSSSAAALGGMSRAERILRHQEEELAAKTPQRIRASTAGARAGSRSTIKQQEEGKDLNLECSDLRLDQLDELSRIRAAFAKHNLTFNANVFEKALLVPEDKSAIECLANLPTPGNNLAPNPLIKQKLAVLVKPKKKVVKKKVKKGKKASSTGKTKKKKVKKKKKSIVD